MKTAELSETDTKKVLSSIAEGVPDGAIIVVNSADKIIIADGELLDDLPQMDVSKSTKISELKPRNLQEKLQKARTEHLQNEDIIHCGYRIRLRGFPLVKNNTKANFGCLILSRKKKDDKISPKLFQYEQIMDTARDGIYVLDKDFHFQTVNNALCEMTGYTKNELLGSHLSLIASQKTIEKSQIKREQLIQNPDETGTVEARHHTKKGESYPVEVRFGPIFDREGDFLGTAGIIRNISQRKQRVEKLQKTIEQKETLMEEIHHRVKNNLQIISSMLKMQINKSPSERVGATLEDALDRIQSIALVHEALYELDNVDELQIKEYIMDLIEQIHDSHSTDDKNITIQTIIDDLTLSFSKSVSIGLIVNELITNAYKHAFPSINSGEIVIRVQEAGTNLSVVVSDNGVGINDAVLEESDSLGFEIIDSLVNHELGGSYTITSEEGTTVHIKFPV